MNFIAPFLDLLYPPRCPGCHRELGRGGELCLDCRARLHPARRAPAPRVPPALDSLSSLGPYLGLLRSLIRRLKFGGRRWILPFLVTEATRRLPPPPVDLILAVPPSPGSPLRDHLADDLARALARSWKLPFLDHALDKARSTPPQRSLSQEERRRNLVDAFRVRRRKELRSRRCLLVDDVCTTGSTLRSVGCAIRAECEPTALHGFVLAHAPLHGEIPTNS